MSSFQEIADSYKKLCNYCETFWNRVAGKFPAEFACAPGCSTCCELQSVNLLEAYVIAGHCGPGIPSAPRLPDSGCPFLTNNLCRIYPARPIICRTHGLLLKSREFRDRTAPSCPFNFTTVDHAAIDDGYALDVDMVTMDLAKLNAAFCLLLGDIKKVSERITLRDLASGKIGRPWFGV